MGCFQLTKSKFAQTWDEQNGKRVVKGSPSKEHSWDHFEGIPKRGLLKRSGKHRMTIDCGKTLRRVEISRLGKLPFGHLGAERYIDQP